MTENKLSELQLKKISVEIKKFFNFLIANWNCMLAQEEVNRHGLFISYKNQTTGIKVSYEPMEGGLFVQLSKLISGDFPKYNIQISPETKVLTFDLLDLLAIHGESQYSSSKQGVEASVREASQSLEKTGAKILGGDFTELLSIEHRVKKRSAENSGK